MMDKVGAEISCGIMQDLLVSYCDGLTAEHARLQQTGGYTMSTL